MTKQKKYCDSSSFKNQHTKLVFKSLITGKHINIPSGLPRLTLLAKKGVDTLYKFFPFQEGYPKLWSTAEAVLRFKKSLALLSAIPDEGWSLFPNYYEVLTLVSGRVRRCCGTLGTSGHEVALRFIDSVGVAITRISSRNLPDIRGDNISNDRFLMAHFQTLSERNIKDVWKEAQKRIAYVKRNEITWLEKQLELEYVKAQHMIDEKENSNQKDQSIKNSPEDITQLLSGIKQTEIDLPAFSANVQQGIISVDDEKYEVDAHHCEIVNALVEADGHNVTGPQMNNLRGCHGKKISREIMKLENQIPALHNYLRHDGNKGYRIVS